MNLSLQLASPANHKSLIGSAVHDILARRTLIIASNRGPVTVHQTESGDLDFQPGSGGLVTALAGVIRHAQASWIACARTFEDKVWRKGLVPLGTGEDKLWMEFLTPSDESYKGYYRVIANPILWFLQHSMWNISREPTIDQTVWQHWDSGYVAVNMLFAEAIARQIAASPQPALVMLQDYHLYLAPGMIRRKFRPTAKYTLAHFVHIPWSGAEDWGFLPPRMRMEILEGLCAVDLLGFQTHEDAINFIRTCESYLSDAQVNYRQGKVRFRNHMTHVRDFPISIDVNSLTRFAQSPEVDSYRNELTELRGDRQIILRIDWIDSGKNIVRGFQAFDQLLELHPEHRGRVKFLAHIVPSRLGISEHRGYLDEVMGMAGRVNAKYARNDWEPIRVLVEENYLRAVAGLQVYDVLLANSIADGMDFVAKEGLIVNCRDGVLVLSDRTGAYQQIASGALVVSPLDIHGTAEAMHHALIMPLEERHERAEHLRSLIEGEDVTDWLQKQLSAIVDLDL